MESDYEIVQDPKALAGEWLEVGKPAEDVRKILSRMGLGMIKSRLVSNKACRMVLTILPEPTEALLNSLPTFEAEVTEGAEKESAGDPDIAASEASTRPSSPKRPMAGDDEDRSEILSEHMPSLAQSPFAHSQSPQSPLTDNSDTSTRRPSLDGETDGTLGKKVAEEASYTLYWSHKQYFPMGFVKESDFLSDGISEHKQLDSDFGLWQTHVIYYEGQLIQRRHSEALGLTMYDTRFVVRKSTNQSEQDAHEDGASSNRNPASYQGFQWKVIDHRENALATLGCYYTLVKIGDA